MTNNETNQMEIKNFNKKIMNLEVKRRFYLRQIKTIEKKIVYITEKIDDLHKEWFNNGR